MNMSPKSHESSLTTWEDARHFLDFFKGLTGVVSCLIFKPSFFFLSLKHPTCLSLAQRCLRAFVFAVILGYLKLSFDILNLFWVRHLTHVVSADVQAQLALASSAVVHSPLFLLRPLLTLGLTFLFVAAGVKLILGFDKPVAGVFLVVCYKNASDIFYALPLAGGFFASVWAVVLLVLGIRHVYGAALLRSILSALVMPFFLFFSVVLSVGPALNKAILRFYPELRSQMIRLNDMTGYMYATGIVNAAKTYKQELGFYPAHLEVLKKYMSRTLNEDVSRQENSTGYIYSYESVTADHFVVKAVPFSPGLTGRFVFYGDESGLIRLNDVSGPVIKNSAELEKGTGPVTEEIKS